jgi:hypothetical protein
VKSIAAALVICLALPASAAPSLNPQAALEAGKEHYRKHEYGNVVDVVHPLLYPSIELPSEDAVVEAHKLLALSYFFMKKENEAEQEVTSLLALRPSYELDQFLEAPVAVRFFQGVRKRQEERLSELRRRQQEEEERRRREDEKRRAEAKAKADRVFIERQVIVRSRLVAMLPFGIGQFQNGHKGAGIALATTQLAFGAASLGLWIGINQRYSTGEVPVRERALGELLVGLQIGTGVAFWASVIAGIIDAQVRFKPKSVIEREIHAPQKDKKTTVSVLPLVSPGLVGLGVGGVF